MLSWPQPIIIPPCPKDLTWISAVSCSPAHWHVLTVLGRASTLRCPQAPCSRDLQTLRGQGWNGMKWGESPSLTFQGGESLHKIYALEWKDDWLKTGELSYKGKQFEEGMLLLLIFSIAIGFLKDIKTSQGWWLQIRELELAFWSHRMDLWRWNFW